MGVGVEVGMGMGVGGRAVPVHSDVEIISRLSLKCVAPFTGGGLPWQLFLHPLMSVRLPDSI